MELRCVGMSGTGSSWGEFSPRFSSRQTVAEIEDENELEDDLGSDGEEGDTSRGESGETRL
jgi:hypothetical protein